MTTTPTNGAVTAATADLATALSAERDQLLRDLARALGMTPGEPAAVLLRRVVEEHQTLVRLMPAVAAFRACYEGLPSHVHTRPVCASPLCDLLPKKNGLCNRCYEQKEGGR